MEKEPTLLSMINIRDRVIPFLARQFKRFEATTKEEKKAIEIILD